MDLLEIYNFTKQILLMAKQYALNFEYLEIFKKIINFRT